ncbi:putative Ribosome biogenesis protein RPF2 [Blattamonas nauphoetae]|uniref:Ribosome production factor 2 homolog n=1 Tax=Blattamonas nauphoetae TaxID=2049346 RepID=A0ABQ9Y2Q6_9EUKA|nr:putative Ribosome biogenesis protein RPF2 [Blattamonas nauphoetae]
MDPAFAEIYAKSKRAKSRRARKALQARLPQAEEGRKPSMIIYGHSPSLAVKEFLKDLTRLTSPHCKLFKKKNQISPFEQTGIQSFEFLSEKNDCPLFVFGDSLKKRPDTLTFGRLFSFQLTDMVELTIKSYSPIFEFAEKSNTFVSPGSKPYLQFNGDAFDGDVGFRMLKSLMLDFFGPSSSETMCLTTSNYVLSFFAIPATSKLPAMLAIRTYGVEQTPGMVDTMQAGQVPPLHLVEIGPSALLSINRTFTGDPDVVKKSYKLPPTHKTKRKNISHSFIPGQIEGRVHVQTQDIDALERKTRKGKALKGAEEILNRRAKEAKSLMKEGDSEGEDMDGGAYESDSGSFEGYNGSDGSGSDSDE